MTNEEYQKLKAAYEKIIADTRVKLDALDEIYKKIKTVNVHKHKGHRKSKSEYTYDPAQDINKTDIMRKSLGELGETFKTKNFKAYLKKAYPRADFYDTFVSNTLGKFVRQGILEIVSGSNGEKKKGYVYRRKTG